MLVQGYVTNWMALYMMFQPVEPWKGPRWLQETFLRATGKEWSGVQGLFLTRQVRRPHDQRTARFVTRGSREGLTTQPLGKPISLLLGTRTAERVRLAHPSRSQQLPRQSRCVLRCERRVSCPLCTRVTRTSCDVLGGRGRRK
jgi:hypothetical protein